MTSPATSRSRKELWVCRAGTANSLAEDFIAVGVVGLTIPFEGDAGRFPRGDIAAALSASNPAQAANMAAMLHHFVIDLDVGDMVVTPAGNGRPVLVGRIVGPYRYERRPRVLGLLHQREVEWRKGPQWEELPAQVRRAISAPTALYRPGAALQIAEALAEHSG